MQLPCRSEVFTRAEACTTGTKENLYLPLYSTYILKLYTFHNLADYFDVILMHLYIVSLHVNQSACQIKVICNEFIWNRQVNCVLLCSLHLKELLIFQVPKFSLTYQIVTAMVQ